MADSIDQHDTGGQNSSDDTSNGGRVAVRRAVRRVMVLRRNIQPQEMLAVVCGFLLLIALVFSMIVPVVHPVFTLAALLFFLYPFRKVIVARRTMQLGIGTFLIWLFLSLSRALFPFIVAFVIAYIFSPLVALLQRKGVPRWASALTVTLGMLGIYTLIGIFVVPAVVEQFQQLFSSAKQLLASANALVDRDQMIATIEKVGVPHAQAKELVVNDIEPQLKEVVKWLVMQLGSFVKNASTILEGVVNLLLIPLLSLYMMIDFGRFRMLVRTKILRDNPRYVYYFRQVDLILSSYLRGIMITSTLVGTAAVIVLSIFNVPYAVVLGILTGVFNLIPSVGIFLNVGVAAIIFLFAPGDFFSNILITSAMVFGLHTLNAYVVEPRVIGDRVGLPPVVLIGSLFVFAHFLGFIGLLVAVPASAVIAMFLKEWYRNAVGTGDDQRSEAQAAGA